LGLGALLDQSVMVDLAYAYQWWEREAGFLSEDVKSHRLQMSIAYRF
jgi:opacity protein-like surface antigen